MEVAGINIENPGDLIKQTLNGIGQLAKDIRTAITGKEPVDAAKAQELALKAQELVSLVDNATIAVSLAEAQSADKWTSRARPTFMYVIYVIILAGIPVAIGALFSPEKAIQFATAFGKWLEAIPDDMWWLFGAGYLGYGAFRSFEKWKAPGTK